VPAAAKDLSQALQEGTLGFSSRISIACRLMEDWSDISSLDSLETLAHAG